MRNKKEKKGKKSKKPRWKEPVSYGDYKGIDDPISTKFDEGAVTFDDKFKVMYFNRSIMKKKENLILLVYINLNKKEMRVLRQLKLISLLIQIIWLFIHVL